MSISVVFTKFENLLNDIKNKMRDQEGLSTQEIQEKTDQVIFRAQEIVNSHALSI